MLNLDAILNIPSTVLFTTVEDNVVLLNTRTNKYYSLDEVGARFWNFLSEGKTLRETHQALLEEYEVEPPQLEQDLLELLADLQENDLVEIV